MIENIEVLTHSSVCIHIIIKTVALGRNITAIGAKAFCKCTKLTASKVGKIGGQAFYGCKNLKKITIKTKKLTSKKVGSKAVKGIFFLQPYN